MDLIYHPKEPLGNVIAHLRQLIGVREQGGVDLGLGVRVLGEGAVFDPERVHLSGAQRGFGVGLDFGQVLVSAGAAGACPGIGQIAKEPPIFGLLHEPGPLLFSGIPTLWLHVFHVLRTEQPPIFGLLHEPGPLLFSGIPSITACAGKP